VNFKGETIMEKKREGQNNALYYDEEGALEVNKQITNVYSSGIVDDFTAMNAFDEEGNEEQ
jgi:hypothetical protein